MTCTGLAQYKWKAQRLVIHGWRSKWYQLYHQVVWLFRAKQCFSVHSITLLTVYCSNVRALSLLSCLWRVKRHGKEKRLLRLHLTRTKYRAVFLFLLCAALVHPELAKQITRDNRTAPAEIADTRLLRLITNASHACFIGAKTSLLTGCS